MVKRTVLYASLNATKFVGAAPPVMPYTGDARKIKANSGSFSRSLEVLL
jgi:hypothetical protein